MLFNFYFNFKLQSSPTFYSWLSLVLTSSSIWHYLYVNRCSKQNNSSLFLLTLFMQMWSNPLNPGLMNLTKVTPRSIKHRFSPLSCFVTWWKWNAENTIDIIIDQCVQTKHKTMNHTLGRRSWLFHSSSVSTSVFGRMFIRLNINLWRFH